MDDEKRYASDQPLDNTFAAAFKKAGLTSTPTPTPVTSPAGKKAAVLAIKLPTIKKLASLDAKLAAVAEEAAEKQTYLGQIGCHIADLVAEIIRFNSLKRMEQESLVADIAAYEDELMTHLALQAQPDKTGRLPLTVWKARVAFAEAIIASVTTRNSLFDIIEGSRFYKFPSLIKLGIMEREGGQSQNLVEVFNQKYGLNGSRNEAERLKELLLAAVSRIKAANSQYYGELRGALHKNATLKDPRLIYSGVNGSVVINVPSTDGAGQRLPGGDMLVESNGHDIKVVAAIGYFQRVMQEIADAGISIPVETLKDESFVPKHRSRSGEDDNRRCQILHRMMWRAKVALDEIDARQIRVKEFQADSDAGREILKETANVSSADWLLKAAVGTALIYLGRNPWVISGEGAFYEVCFLIERAADGKIRIPESGYPERLSELFGNKFSEWFDPGERFRDTGYPLGAMLKVAYAQEQRRSNEEADHEATRKWLEEEKRKEGKPV